jgi:hypothetical protein
MAIYSYIRRHLENKTVTDPRRKTESFTTFSFNISQFDTVLQLAGQWKVIVGDSGGGKFR